MAHFVANRCHTPSWFVELRSIYSTSSMSDEFPSEPWGKFTSHLPNILLSTEYAPGPRTPSAKLTTIATIKWNRSTLSLAQSRQNSRHPANAAAYGVRIPITRQTAAPDEPIAHPIDWGAA